MNDTTLLAALIPQCSGILQPARRRSTRAQLNNVALRAREAFE